MADLGASAQSAPCYVPGRVGTRSDPRLVALVFGSGACALAYQTVWTRQLRLLFGASTSASAAVLAAFMLGLGVGAAWWGRRCEADPRPLQLYARLELGIAALAAASPLLLALLRAVYLSLGGESRLGPLPAAGLRLLGTALMIGAPAWLMGGTLPALARAYTDERDLERRDPARLYGVNTLGAVFGALATGFLLMEWWGLSATLWVFSALNAALALAAWRLGRVGSPHASALGAALPTEAEATMPTVSAPSKRSRSERGWVWFAAFGVGFVFFAMEMVWYRALAPILGGTTYAFAFVLATALAGVGLGGLLYARVPGRASWERVAWTCAIEAVALAIPWALGDRVPALALQLRSLLVFGFAGEFVLWSSLTGLVVFPAALVAGYQFPLLVAACGRARDGLAVDLGWVYAFNTVGAVVGAVAAGFGLLPALGIHGLWRGCMLILCGLSVGFALRARPLRVAPLAPLLLATAMIFGGDGPTPLWMHNPIGAGRLEVQADEESVWRELEVARSELLWARDGVESSVAVMHGEGLSFRVNGKTDGAAQGDAATVVMAPLIGAALHPAPRQGLVIGLGTGSSAGWLAAVEGMERVDVVELEPAMVEFAALCGAVNHEALDDPRVALTLGDAREFVQTRDARWDVVMSEPSNPYRAGVASLFSVEFYRALDGRMSDDAVFVQWLQAYEVDARAVAIVLASMHEVFGHVEVWIVSGGDLALVARKRPAPLDLAKLDARLSAPPFDRALDWMWGVHGVEGLLAARLAGPALAAKIAANPLVPREHDDRPQLEFGFARGLASEEFVTAADVLAAARESNALDEPGTTPLDPVRIGEARQILGRRVESDLGRDWVADEADADARREARDRMDDGEWLAALESWDRQGALPRHPDDQLRVAIAALTALDWERAETILRELAALHPTDVALLRARIAEARGQPERQFRFLRQAFESARFDPWFNEPLMRGALRRMVPDLAEHSIAWNDELFALLEEPFAVEVNAYYRRRARLLLALGSRFESRCEEALRVFEPHPPLDAEVLEARVECYRAPHRLAAEAIRDLADYEAISTTPTLSGWLDEAL